MGGVVHKLKSSSWWNDTWTSWCGGTWDKDDVDRTWFSSTNCKGCLAALKAAGKKP